MKPTPHTPSVNPLTVSIEKRLRRIESRLVQLMLHQGLDPYSRVYEGDEPGMKSKEKTGGDHQ